jgi:hypothetical protein
MVMSILKTKIYGKGENHKKEAAELFHGLVHILGT